VEAIDVVGLLLRLLHLWVWALYCGGLTYIYFSFVPGVRRWLTSDQRDEELALATADGLRWWIFGAILTADATDGGLVLVRAATPAPWLWWAIVGIKTALFLATLALYAYVSYVMWPRRIFAAAEDRPAVRRRFLRVAWLLIALLTSQLLLGAAAHVAR
jgi:hypothetical protein